MTKTDRGLEDIVGQQSKTINDLSGTIASLAQEKFVLQAGKENLETQYHKLRDFIQGLGLRVDTIENGVWLKQASRLLNITLHEDNIDKRLGFPTEDAKDQILHIARSLFAPTQVRS